MKYIMNGLLFMAAASLTAQAQVAKKFSLAGNIANAPAGKVFLYYHTGTETKRDSTLLRNGAFQFTGSLAEPVMATLVIGDGRRSSDDPNSTNIFLEPAAVMQLAASYGNLINAAVKGAALQSQYQLFRAAQQKISTRWKQVMDTLSAINRRSNFAFQETKAWVLSPYHAEMEELEYDFIKKYPNSYVTAYLLQFSRNYSLDSIRKWYAAFPAPVKNSMYGKQIATRLEESKKGAPGTMAAGFTATDINKQPISLSDFKGKYVLLDFWASWCLPCRKLNPHLKELYAKYKDKGFEVIGVSDDDRNPQAWLDAVKKDGLPWKQVLRGMKMEMVKDRPVFDRTNDISYLYNIHSLPTQVLIDRNGKVVARYGGEGGEPHEALDKKLEELL